MCIKLITLLLLCAQAKALLEFNDITWKVHNSNGSLSLPAKVPGGIYSDLRAAGIIGDILYRFNDVTTRWVANETWTYTGSFTVTEKELNHDVANLVLHGVDTVAFVELNSSPLGHTNNMFVRYVFDCKPHLKLGENVLQISFVSPIQAANQRSEEFFTLPDCVPAEYHGECHVNQLRKMQASFGWDWGPAFPSVGLWKPVSIELYNRAIVRDVTTHLEKVGQHWYLKIIAYLEAGKRNGKIEGIVKAELTVEGPQKISIAKRVDTNVKSDGSAQVKLNLTISENVVRLWWPNRYGDQVLYDLKVSINSDSGEEHHKNIRIGFRTVELIEEDASIKLANDSEAGRGLTFYFKVNGYPMFMKGSNWIPGRILPEESGDKDNINGILDAAMDANMNMLRVWGGGVYESDFFYQRCDEIGILIWQDFLFACSMYPTDQEFIDSVRVEVEQNVKRLQHHTSIAVWAGNNENEAALRGNWYGTSYEFLKYKKEYIQLYVKTIKPIVNELDPDRRYLISSPSDGIKSERQGYIANNPYDSHFGDTHYYNYIDDNWNMNIYPPTRFASEYGFQSLPTLLTMESATNETEDYKIDSVYSIHRQHSPDGYEFIRDQIEMHLKMERGNLNDYEYFKKFVLYSQINQAMAMKAETEFYRQSQETWYTMGALYWQINDLWQAPSWSSMDYERRWKMLHYFAVNFFAPVLVSPRLLPHGEVDVYLINDRFVPIVDGEITVDLFNWNSTTPTKTTKYLAQVDPMTAKKQDINLEFWKQQNKESILLKFTLKANGVERSPANFVFPTTLKSIKGLKKPNIQIIVSDAPKMGDLYVFWLDIKVDTVVLFLWLETPPILHSYFDENGLVITTPEFRTKYVSSVEVTAEEVQKMITYQYYFEEE